MTRKVLTATALGFSLLLAGPAIAQEREQRSAPTTSQSATGTIRGVVTDADGNPIPNAKVVLLQPPARGQPGASDQKGPRGPSRREGRDGRPEGRPGGDAGGPPDDRGPGVDAPRLKGPRAAGQRPGERWRDRKPVAEAHSNESGDFEVSGVPVGRYMIVARVPGVGVDGQRVRVREQRAADVELILEPMAERRGRGGQGRGFERGQKGPPEGRE